MKFKQLLLLFTISMMLPGGLLWAATYKVDHSHSEIEFAVKHMMISTVKGNFGTYDVTIDNFDENNVEAAKVTVTIDAATINTKNADRDEHLRGEDFFDTAKYPEITFVSKEIKSAKEENHYQLVGDLTMRGVTREVAFDFILNGVIQDPWGNTKLGAEAELVIDRQDWGVSWSKTLDSGGLVVSDEVKIFLAIQAAKQ